MIEIDINNEQRNAAMNYDNKTFYNLSVNGESGIIRPNDLFPKAGTFFYEYNDIDFVYVSNNHVNVFLFMKPGYLKLLHLVDKLSITNIFSENSNTPSELIRRYDIVIKTNNRFALMFHERKFTNLDENYIVLMQTTSLNLSNTSNRYSYLGSEDLNGGIAYPMVFKQIVISYVFSKKEFMDEFNMIEMRDKNSPGLNNHNNFSFSRINDVEFPKINIIYHSYISPVRENFYSQQSNVKFFNDEYNKIQKREQEDKIQPWEDERYKISYHDIISSYDKPNETPYEITTQPTTSKIHYFSPGELINEANSSESIQNNSDVEMEDMTQNKNNITSILRKRISDTSSSNTSSSNTSSSNNKISSSQKKTTFMKKDVPNKEQSSKEQSSNKNIFKLGTKK